MIHIYVCWGLFALVSLYASKLIWDVITELPDPPRCLVCALPLEIDNPECLSHGELEL